MSALPDIAGFIAADKNMRQKFGNPIIFSVPTTPQWPAGTRINPDTNTPYSAMVVQENPAYATVTVVCSVILKEASPLRPQADTMFAQPGLMSGMDIILDVDADDYPVVQDATEFAYAGRNYKVEEQKPFAIANITYRWLIYGKGTLMAVLTGPQVQQIKALQSQGYNAAQIAAQVGVEVGDVVSVLGTGDQRVGLGVSAQAAAAPGPVLVVSPSLPADGSAYTIDCKGASALIATCYGSGSLTAPSQNINLTNMTVGMPVSLSVLNYASKPVFFYLPWAVQNQAVQGDYYYDWQNTPQCIPNEAIQLNGFAASPTTVMGALVATGKQLSYGATPESGLANNYTMQPVFDSGTLFKWNNAAATTVTFPQLTNPWAYFSFDFLQMGAGAINFAGGSGVTLQSRTGTFKTGGPWNRVRAQYLSTNVVLLTGDLG